MKTFRGTQLLLLTLVLLGGYTYWFEIVQKEQAQERKEYSDMILGSAEVEDIVAFEIEGKVRVVMQGDEWWLHSPVNDLAHQLNVRDALKKLVDSKSERKITSPDLKVLGLEPPQAKVKLEMRDGDTQTFTVSSIKNFEGKSYLKMGEEVLLADTAWNEVTAKEADDFRSEKLYRGTPEDILKVTVLRNGEIQTEFGLKGAVWSSDLKDMKYDALKVERWVRDIRRGNSSHFMSEKGNDPEELKKYQLDKPEYEIRMLLKEGEWRAVVSPADNKDRFVKVDSRHTIYRVKNKIFRDALEMQPKDFWDKKQPFHFSKDEVESLKIERAGKTIEYRRESGGWPKSEIESMLSQLSNWEADKFPSGDEEKLGLPEVRIVLNSKSAKLLDVAWTKSNLKDFINVKSSLYDQIVPVRSSRVQGLKLDVLAASKSPQ